MYEKAVFFRLQDMQASDVYHFVLCGINSSIQVFKCAFVMYSIKETHGLMECRLIMGFYHSTFSDSSKMENAFVYIHILC